MKPTIQNHTVLNYVYFNKIICSYILIPRFPHLYYISKKIIIKSIIRFKKVLDTEVLKLKGYSKITIIPKIIS